MTNSYTNKRMSTARFTLLSELEDRLPVRCKALSERLGETAHQTMNTLRSAYESGLVERVYRDGEDATTYWKLGQAGLDMIHPRTARTCSDGRSGGCGAKLPLRYFDIPTGASKGAYMCRRCRRARGDDRDTMTREEIETFEDKRGREANEDAFARMREHREAVGG